MRRPDGYACVVQYIFGARISQFLEAEDVRCGNGTRTAFANSCGKLFEPPYAAASNDWDRNPGGDATQQFGIVTVAHAVTIDRIDEDFTCAAGRRLGGPIAGQSSSRPAAAVSDNFIASIASASGVDRNDNRLFAISIGRVGDESRCFDGGGIDHDTIGARL